MEICWLTHFIFPPKITCSICSVTKNQHESRVLRPTQHLFFFFSVFVLTHRNFWFCFSAVILDSKIIARAARPYFSSRLVLRLSCCASRWKQFIPVNSQFHSSQLRQKKLHFFGLVFDSDVTIKIKTSTRHGVISVHRVKPPWKKKKKISDNSSPPAQTFKEFFHWRHLKNVYLGG